MKRSTVLSLPLQKRVPCLFSAQKMLCQFNRKNQFIQTVTTGPYEINTTRGCSFSHVRPFYERAESNLNPCRSMHKSVQVAHSSFIEGSHTTKNTASVFVIIFLKHNLFRKIGITKRLEEELYEKTCCKIIIFLF